MLYGMYVSAAGAMANSYRQDVIANNLANVETVAFKSDLALLQARRTEAQLSGQRTHTTAMLEGIGGGIFALPTVTDFSPATLEQTDSPYDLALTDKGFFQVQKDDQVCYTRDGRLTYNTNNELVTIADKLPVLSDAGSPIVIDPQSGKLHVDEVGNVSQGDTVIAKLGIVDFEDTRVLRKQGNNLYISEDAPGQPTEPVIKQGFIETSGVNQVDQLTALIDTSRQFQTNLTMLQIQDQTLGLAVTRLGSVS
ncbi:MAG: flagellar hook-basal body protein [Sedimentisphaerales bacterium]|nr:flagellar hook-basal body protein [Sedimentisphaerales bacterium]